MSARPVRPLPRARSGFATHPGYWGPDSRCLVLPFGFLTLAFALLPVGWAIASARSAILVRRRGRPGFCRRCGYNLTGNESGRCSECGEVVAAEAK